MAIHADIGSLARASLVESLREQTRRTPGGLVQEAGGILLYSTPDPCPIGYFNGLVRVDPDVPAAVALAAADAYFASRSRSYTTWVEDGIDADLDEAVRDAGRHLVNDRVTMRYDLDAEAERLGIHDRLRIPPDIESTAPADLWSSLIVRLVDVQSGRPIELLPGIEVRRVTTDADAAAFVQVTSEAYSRYGTPGSAIRAAFGRSASLHGPHVAGLLVRCEGEPAAGALAYVSHQVGCVTWVGRRPDVASPSGPASDDGTLLGTLGEVATLSACVSAYLMGASWVAGPATALGERLYARLGGEVFTRHRWYVQAEAHR